MSIYDKASLVLIPSGTKTSKVYSQKPTNGDGDFTFSRSTAATRVNASGNIEKETQNLLLHSNSFDDAIWSHGSITLTGGQAGYDGSNNAWELNKAAAAYVSLYQAISNSNVVTGTFYVKAGTLTTAALYSSTTTTPNAFAHFDLTNGNLLSSAGIVDASSEDVGNGWWRLSMVVSKGIFNLRIYPDWSGSTAGTIYVQDAQLEQGLVARDYIETTTTAIYGGITDNVPRLDYTDSSCPALLLEPQRTNRVNYSEYIGSYWSTSNSSVSNNAVTSPEGVDNAFELTDNTSNGYHWIYRAGVASVADHRISFFAKANTLSQVWSNGGSGSNSAGFDLSNGTIAKQSGSANAKIEDYGNGWYRCSFTSDATGILIATMKNNDETYAGTGQSIYMYGIQSEQEASYATSYIPTYGSAVTRNADSCLNAGNASTFNSTEGVLYWEGSFDSTSTIAGAIALIGANSNRVQLYNSGSNLVVLVTPNGSTSFTASTNGSVDITSNHKYAVKWALNDFAFWVDGVEIATDTSGVTFNDNALTELRFSDFGANYLYANTKQVLTFNTALSNNELQDLTTL